MSKFQPLFNCSEPNEEIQIDFGGLIESFSKYPIVEVFDKGNGPNVTKFLDEYIQIHGVARVRLDQARCIFG